jgi:hypothetical protein
MEEATITRPAREPTDREPERERGGNAARNRALRAVTWIVPFALVVYLGLRGGGYDPVVRGEAGLVVWWALAIAAIAGVLPAAGWRRTAWLALGLLAALAAWTGLSMLWTESGGRTFEELARVSIYVGVLGLALALQGREGLRLTLGGVCAGIGVLAVLALLSRLVPGPFPENELAEVQSEDRARLAYPLNHWNALATLVAVGLPLMAAAALSGTRRAYRALATAALPVMALVVFLTISRTGLIASLAALATFVALHPRRLAILPTAAVVGVASAACIAFVAARDDLQDGLANSAATSQGRTALVFVAIVCGLAALARVGIEKLAARRRLDAPRVERRTAVRAAVAAGAVIVLAAVVAGAPGKAADTWEDFKRPVGPGSDTERLESTTGNGRYQYWSSAARAGAEEPVLGIGAGAFEFWWQRDGDLQAFSRYAHSLYLETFAELGLPGLLMILALLALIIVAIARRIGAAGSGERVLLAAAAGAVVAFVIAAATDWTWQVTVIPVAILFVSAPALVGRAGPPAGRRIAERLALVVPAVAATAILLVSVVGTILYSDSEEAARAGDLDHALARAEQSGAWQPFSAAPLRQQALVQLEAGEPAEAVDLATEATEKEETNWENWYVLAQAHFADGNEVGARYAYAKARSLNPRSELLESEGLPF